jgi:diguanylate cyclase (GGDEF)-like protein
LLAEQYESEIGALFTDSLAGLYNNGYFEISLANEVKRSERYGNVFSTALINVDSFSHLNMSHGPLEGDRLLKDVSGIIKKNIREVDLAVRYSGNSFAIIVTESNCQQTLVVAERIRSDVAHKSNGDSTVSIGMASCPDDATTERMLIKKANAALIKAKLHGKNNIHSAKNRLAKETHNTPTILIVDDDS